MNRKLTKEQQEVVNEIRKLHARKQPLNISAVRSKYPELLIAAYKVKPFWGWKQAIEAAELDYRKIKVKIPKTIACKVCGARRMRLDPHIRFHHDLSSAQYQRKYGTQPMSSDAIKIKRIDKRSTNLVVPHWEPHWSPEYALDRLYQFYKMGIPLHPSNLEQVEKNLYRWTRHFFGTYDTALLSVGLDPEKTRKAKPKKNWTKKSLIKAVRRMKLQHKEVNYRAMLKYDRSITWIAPKLFGSYDKMLEATGLDPQKERKCPKPKIPYKTESDVICGICRRKLKDMPLNTKSVATGETRDLPLYNKARRLFGTWEAAIEASGFDYNNISEHRNPYTTRRKAIAEIKRRHTEKLPLQIKEVRYGKKQDPQLYVAALNLFKTWQGAIEKAGISYDEVHPSKAKYPTKEAVIMEIKRRHREEMPLNSKSLFQEKDKDIPLYMKARKLFKTWGAAVEAAGIDYSSVSRFIRKKMRPSKTAIKGEKRNSQIIRMYKKGMTFRELAEHFSVSSCRIGQIVKMERERKRADINATGYIARVRKANDINKLWVAKKLLRSLKLPIRAVNPLIFHFTHKKGKNRISLRDLMDVTVAPDIGVSHLYLDGMPVSSLKSIHMKTVAQMVRRFSDVDLGDRFQKEWTNRKAKLKCYLDKHLKLKSAFAGVF